MELSIERMVEGLISAIGLGRHSAKIIAVLSIIYFVLDRTYKCVNYKFYKIPRKYFKLITFRELVIYSIIIIIIVFIVSYSFLDVIKSSIILNFLLPIFIVALAVADFFHKFIDKNIKITTSLNKNKLTKLIFDNINVTIVALVVYTIVFYISFHSFYKLSFYNIIIGIIIYLSLLNIFFLVLNLFSKNSNLFINIYNNDIGRHIFYIFEIIYVFLMLLALFSTSSSLIHSNKILNELDTKTELYFGKAGDKEKTTVNGDKNKCESENQRGLQNLSDHIVHQVNDSSNWKTSDWIYNFKNSENLIASYYDITNMQNIIELNVINEIIDFKSCNLNCMNKNIIYKDTVIKLKDLCDESRNKIIYGRQFLALLKNADMKNEFLDVIKLSLILTLLNNYTIIGLASIALLIFLAAYTVIIKYIYFNPSNIREYEFIEDDSGNKKYFIAEYKNTIMVMAGKEINQTLYLFKGSYEFIKLEKDRLIKLKEYESVKPIALCRDVLEYQELLNSKKIGL